MRTLSARGTISVAALGLVLALGLVGCGQAPDQSEDAGQSAADGLGGPDDRGSRELSEGGGESSVRSVGGSEGESAAPAEPATGRADPAGRAVIHRIDVTVETTDVAGAARTAGRAAETAGGFVESERTDASDRDAGPVSIQLVLRVPVDRRGDVVARLEGLGQVVGRSRSAEDVTDQLVDVKSRTESQRRSIERLRALLDDAATLGDVISIEGELARREADLDSLLRRQQELSKLADLATVTATFAAPGTVQPEESELGFLAGLRGGWKAFAQAMVVAATILGGLLPFAIVVVLVGLPVRWVWRRQRKPHPDSGPA